MWKERFWVCRSSIRVNLFWIIFICFDTLCFPRVRLPNLLPKKGTQKSPSKAENILFVYIGPMDREIFWQSGYQNRVSCKSYKCTEKVYFDTLNQQSWRCSRRTVARNAKTDAGVDLANWKIFSVQFPQMPDDCSELLVLFAQLLHKIYNLVLW